MITIINPKVSKNINLKLTIKFSKPIIAGESNPLVSDNAFLFSEYVFAGDMLVTDINDRLSIIASDLGFNKFAIRNIELIADCSKNNIAS